MKTNPQITEALLIKLLEDKKIIHITESEVENLLKDKYIRVAVNRCDDSEKILGYSFRVENRY